MSSEAASRAVAALELMLGLAPRVRSTPADWVPDEDAAPSRHSRRPRPAAAPESSPRAEVPVRGEQRDSDGTAVEGTPPAPGAVHAAYVALVAAVVRSVRDALEAELAGADSQADMLEAFDRAVGSLDLS